MSDPITRLNAALEDHFRPLDSEREGESLALRCLHLGGTLLDEVEGDAPALKTLELTGKHPPPSARPVYLLGVNPSECSIVLAASTYQQGRHSKDLHAWLTLETVLDVVEKFIGSHRL